jgi:hypothetical protein
MPNRLGRHIYHPNLILPLVTLVQLMVAINFNFAQLALILVSKGMRYAVKTVRHQSHVVPLTRKCKTCTC